MFFHFFNNVNLKFDTKKLIQRFYITLKALPTTKRVKIINKHKFILIILNKYFDTFVIYIAALEMLMAIYLNKTALIDDLQQDKAYTKITAEYENYADVFLSNLAIKLSKNTSTNNYAIELENKKQQLYRPYIF